MIETEFDYISKSDLGAYAGKWIAVFGEKVVVAGKTFKEVAEKVDKEFPGKKVLLSKVPEKMAQIF